MSVGDFLELKNHCCKSMAGYPLGSYCYSGASMGNMVNPHAQEETASDWWDTAHREDKRRHDWMIQQEKAAKERLERQILKRNTKMLPGDFSIARLGETAHKKGILADCLQSEACEQDTELRAERHRTTSERVENWNHYSRPDRIDWVGHHGKRMHHSNGFNVGLYHNEYNPQNAAAWQANKSVEAYEAACQARIEVNSSMHAKNVFTNNNCVGERPREGFYSHIRKPYAGPIDTAKSAGPQASYPRLYG